MLKLSFPGRPLFAGIALLSMAAVVGCAGSQSGVTPQASTQASLQAHSPIVPDKQCSPGRVKVDPCAVTLTVSAPTATVSVKSGNKHDTISEKDNCGGASGMATVTQGTGDTWLVAAGATTGTCTATFTATDKHGKTKGSADLSITNDV